jgi:hypothetical protein
VGNEDTVPENQLHIHLLRFNMIEILSYFQADFRPTYARCSVYRTFALTFIAVVALSLFPKQLEAQTAARPHIVLVMADDQGWGQMGYYQHPILKTPNLDAMSQAGLRFDRFYAGAPVCSPTRASVLTGRANDRTGVESHGYALRRQEITIAKMLSDAGYVTGHFGKWHLNALRGPGVPILKSDDHNPGEFGFQTWLSVTNFLIVIQSSAASGNSRSTQVTLRKWSSPKR